MGIRSAKSLPKPGRTVADTAADVRAICAELGIERLVTTRGTGPRLRLIASELVPSPEPLEAVAEGEGATHMPPELRARIEILLARADDANRGTA